MNISIELWPRGVDFVEARCRETLAINTVAVRDVTVAYCFSFGRDLPRTESSNAEHISFPGTPVSLGRTVVRTGGPGVGLQGQFVHYPFQGEGGHALRTGRGVEVRSLGLLASGLLWWPASTYYVVALSGVEPLLLLHRSYVIH